MFQTRRPASFSLITATLVLLFATASSFAADWVTRTKDGLLNINFPGGSIAEYCQGLREASPDHNIVVEENASYAPLPVIVLNNVTPSFAVSILSELKQTVIHHHHPASEQENGATLDVVTTDGSYHFTDPNAEPFIQSNSPPRVNIAFPGGTINDFVQLIKRARDDVNIVVMPEAANFPVPSLELHDVTVSAALQIIDGTLRPGESGHFQKLNARSFQSHRGLFRIEVDRPMRNEKTNVWSVAEMLLANNNPDVSADQLLAGIQAALSLYQNPAKVLYHEQLALIIIRGPQEQINVADLVIDRSFESANHRSQSDNRFQNELAMLEHQMRVAESQNRVHEKELQIAQNQIALLEQVEDSSGNLQFQLAEAELRVVKAEAELTNSRSELQLLQQEHSRILQRITASKNINDKQ